jgi:molybdopterin synthase catalytic subunit
MQEPIRVTVRCFSHVRHVLGDEVITLELPAGATAETVLRRVREMSDMRLTSLPMRVAINQEFVAESAALRDGDEVALIPPVQGGRGPTPIVEARITEEPIGEARAPEAARDAGAELVFRGIVRPEEGGQAIVALDYEHYPDMAARELRRLAEETADRFRLHELRCVQRVGRVGVGEPSLEVVIRARHRAETLDAMAWFIGELKLRVPIWKWGVTGSGGRFPSRAGSPARRDPAR